MSLPRRRVVEGRRTDDAVLCLAAVFPMSDGCVAYFSRGSVVISTLALVTAASSGAAEQTIVLKAARLFDGKGRALGAIGVAEKIAKA